MKLLGEFFLSCKSRFYLCENGFSVNCSINWNEHFIFVWFFFRNAHRAYTYLRDRHLYPYNRRHIHHHTDTQTHESILQICAQLIANNSFAVRPKPKKWEREGRTLGVFYGILIWFLSSGGNWVFPSFPNPPPRQQNPGFWFIVDLVMCRRISDISISLSIMA